MTDKPSFTARDAVEYFHAKGLTFDDLSPMEFRILDGMLAESLLEFNRLEDTNNTLRLTLGGRVCNPDQYRICVDGYYFTNRTCVLISKWEVLIMPWAASCYDFVTVPFMKWCDMVASWKEDGTLTSTVRRMPVPSPEMLMWAVCSVKSSEWDEDVQEVDCICIMGSKNAATGAAVDILLNGDDGYNDVWVFPYGFGDNVNDGWDEEDAWKASEHTEEYE